MDRVIRWTVIVLNDTHAMQKGKHTVKEQWFPFRHGIRSSGQNNSRVLLVRKTLAVLILLLFHPFFCGIILEFMDIVLVGTVNFIWYFFSSQAVLIFFNFSLDKYFIHQPFENIKHKGEYHFLEIYTRYSSVT